MRGSEIRFYGDQNDLADQFERFSRLGNFNYTQTLSALNARNYQIRDPSGLLGFLVTSDSQPVSVFLVSDKGEDLSFKEIRMEDRSGIKHAVDQVANRDSVLIRLGGCISPSTLIATSINTTGESPRAKELFKIFKKTIASEAAFINGFYVLPCALKKFQAGWRLTTGASHSPALDLKDQGAMEEIGRSAD